MPEELTYRGLISAIENVHRELAAQAGRAVNVSLTVRNWLIGLYIAEFELRGKDRAEYGDGLFSSLATELTGLGVKNCNRRQLYRYTRFYRLYPWIVGALPPQSRQLLPPEKASGEIVGAVSPQLHPVPGQLVTQLSYTHIEMLVDLDDDDLRRAFYEIECIRGNWSVRELRRQIASLYYERSGLSKDKKKLAELVQSAAEHAEPALNIRDPYVSEFLGIKPRQVMHESDLEAALTDKLQAFLLELGTGFCFEARQKRILIGDEHFFIDLVFYHRILKCHVLVELKTDEFRHEHLGQLNTYMSWYRTNETREGDNPPVGILLCTRKNHAVVQYALAGMTNQLFVSKYQLELPSKEQIEQFLDEQLRETAR